MLMIICWDRYWERGFGAAFVGTCLRLIAGGKGDWYAVRAEHVGNHFIGDPPAMFVAGMEDWTDVCMYQPEA